MDTDEDIDISGADPGSTNTLTAAVLVLVASDTLRETVFTEFRPELSDHNLAN